MFDMKEFLYSFIKKEYKKNRTPAGSVPRPVPYQAGFVTGRSRTPAGPVPRPDPYPVGSVPGRFRTPAGSTPGQ